MNRKKRELPEPPGGPFGRKRRFGERVEAPGTADRLAAAMMEGRVEEFIEEEFGDIPHAKELAMMMLGATGMMPAAAKSKSGGKSATGKKKPGKSPEAPEEVMKAAEGGDIQKLGNLLAEELRNRSGGVEAHREDSPKGKDFDRADIDTLLEIAAKNNVSIEWVFARAIKLYARDYRTTGRI